MKRLSLMAKTLHVLAIAITFGSVALPAVQAQTETVLYSFDDNGTDGLYPAAPLVRDAKGNLYGTTNYGGANRDGTVFELTSSGTETILYSFGETASDGQQPKAGLIRDTKGNLYGTTYLGGAHCEANGDDGCGTVFELSASGTETILYSFGKTATDGQNPYAGLIRDTEGNLYGTTYYGGTGTCLGGMGCGTVFELTSSGTETILHRFDDNGTNGYQPAAGLVLDTKGNLYGTTQEGGAYDCGIVFELMPSRTETILYSFGKTATDGCSPWSGLIRDTKGNLYGTTLNGGAYGDGTVFELTPSGTETILHSFGETATDGQNPEAGLIRDTKGNLFGTTFYGGAGDCPYACGTVFELTPSGTETILHSFGETAADGRGPDADLIQDTEGNLYGTTFYGGAYSYGTVFEVKP